MGFASSIRAYAAELPALLAIVLFVACAAAYLGALP
jgi:hypothetical protein